jgi:hypothetical protein
MHEEGSCLWQARKRTGRLDMTDDMTEDARHGVMRDERLNADTPRLNNGC